MDINEAIGIANKFLAMNDDDLRKEYNYNPEDIPERECYSAQKYRKMDIREDCDDRSAEDIIWIVRFEIIFPEDEVWSIGAIVIAVDDKTGVACYSSDLQ